MKRVLIIVMGAVLCSSAVFGQAGYIGLFVDPGIYQQCEYTDDTTALVPVYVVHGLTPGATASQWMVIASARFDCTYTGEMSSWPTVIGNSQTGISVAYGACMVSPILMLTINYFCTGTSLVCAHLEVVPDPAAPTGTIEVVDCSFLKMEGVGARLIVNNDGTCPCYLTPVENSNWGRIKALY